MKYDRRYGLNHHVGSQTCVAHLGAACWREKHIVLISMLQLSGGKKEKDDEIEVTEKISLFMRVPAPGFRILIGHTASIATP